MILLSLETYTELVEFKEKHAKGRIRTETSYCGGLIPCKCKVDYFTNDGVLVDFNKRNEQLGKKITGLENLLEHKCSEIKRMIEQESSVKGMSLVEFIKWKRA